MNQLDLSVLPVGHAAAQSSIAAAQSSTAEFVAEGALSATEQAKIDSIADAGGGMLDLNVDDGEDLEDEEEEEELEDEEEEEEEDGDEDSD